MSLLCTYFCAVHKAQKVPIYGMAVRLGPPPGCRASSRSAAGPLFLAISPKFTLVGDCRAFWPSFLRNWVGAAIFRTFGMLYKQAPPPSFFASPMWEYHCAKPEAPSKFFSCPATKTSILINVSISQLVLYHQQLHRRRPRSNFFEPR